LSKSARYFYDADAVREPGGESGWSRQRANGEDTWKYTQDRRGAETGGKFGAPTLGDGATRNLRSVWTVSTQPFSEAHFATFPTALVEPCVKAGTSERGACPTCGTPWERVGERESNIDPAERERALAIAQERGAQDRHRAGSGLRAYAPTVTTTGFRPTCDCYDDRYREDFPYPRSARKRWQRDISGDHWRRVRQRPGLDGWAADGCIVLDPFCGTATAGEVALLHGRRFIGIDLSEEYVTQFARPALQAIEAGGERHAARLRRTMRAAKRVADAESAGQLDLFGGDA
ncbi:MAG TPA: DNA methyltransferase, partial [Phycisphaerae bacterium]|nr:DNA methyltransferase [Phycisphaerae bacterium]